MKKIVFLDSDSIHPGIVFRKPSFKHSWTNHPKTKPEQVIKHCADNEIVLTNKVLIDRTTLEACPNIQHIAVTATGYNIIDIAACNDHNVSVSNIPHYSISSVPEHVLAATMTLRRQMLNYRQGVIDGLWEKSEQFCFFDKPIQNIKGSTFGVIGFGSLGEATAKLMHAIGMKIIYTSRSEKICDFGKQVDLKTLLQEADVISLHCPLVEASKNLIGETELQTMKEDAILINLARGGIVNEQALTEAIKNKMIGGMATDVLIQEPPSPNSSPLLSIANRDNVILTPHIGWASMEAMQTLADQLIDNIESFFYEKPQNIVS